MAERRIRPVTYLIFFAAFALVAFVMHAGYLSLPFFWDELGYFVPAAIDLYREHLLIPRLTLASLHPPGVMAYLAGVWSLTGYSIAATRCAMLFLATLGVLFTFLLAIRMCRWLDGTPAFAAAALLIFSPLFYTQSMMALLDLPAMVVTVLALLMFVNERYRAAAAACTVLVFTKETGILVPVVLAAWLVFERKWRSAALFLIPAAGLGGWTLAIWSHTGNPFGNREFVDYNVLNLLHPMRIAGMFLRRVYYLAIGDFHWVGTIAIAIAWRKSRIFRTREWAVVTSVAGGYVVAFSVFGGAGLERYLLPALPVLYIAVAAAWSLMPKGRRRAWQAVMVAGFLVSLVFNTQLWPAPRENNLAMADFVELHRAAAEFIERDYPTRTVHTAWPLSDALRRPEFGFTHAKVAAVETVDFTRRSLDRFAPGSVEVFVLYSRDWDPPYNLFRIRLLGWMRERWFGYQPQMPPEDIAARFGLSPVAHWSRRGQWIMVFARVPRRPAVRL